MSSKDDEDKVLRCVKVIFAKVINPDEKWLRHFFLFLRDEELITKGQKKDLEKVLKDRGRHDAVSELLILIETREDGWREFSGVLNDEDLQVDKRAKEIVATILTSDQLVDEMLSLVLLWDELLEDRDAFKVIIEEIWRGYDDFDDDNWPLNFIHFCLTTSQAAESQERVRKFISSISSPYSDDHSQEDKTLICLKIILRECIGNDKKKMRYINLVIRDEGIIDKEKKKNIDVMIKNNESDAALLEMISLVDASEKGIKYFEEVVCNEDFDTESKLKNLVSALLEEKPLEEAKLKLIMLWPELIESREDVKPVIHQMWQDNQGLTDINWPLNFIHFCVMQYGERVQTVEDFVSSISFLQSMREKEEMLSLSRGASSEHDHPDSSVQNEAPSLELESFVVLDNPENSGSSEITDGDKKKPQIQQDEKDEEENLKAVNEKASTEQNFDQQAENAPEQENSESEDDTHLENNQQNQSHLHHDFDNAETISTKSTEKTENDVDRTNRHIEDASWEVTSADFDEDRPTEEPPLQYQSENSSLAASTSQDDHDHAEVQTTSHQEVSANMRDEPSIASDPKRSSVSNGSTNDQQGKNPEGRKETEGAGEKEAGKPESTDAEQGHISDPLKIAGSRQEPGETETSDSDSDEDDQAQAPLKQLDSENGIPKPITGKNDVTANASQQEVGKMEENGSSTLDGPQITVPAETSQRTEVLNQQDETVLKNPSGDGASSVDENLIRTSSAVTQPNEVPVAVLSNMQGASSQKEDDGDSSKDGYNDEEEYEVLYDIPETHTGNEGEYAGYQDSVHQTSSTVDEKGMACLDLRNQMSLLTQRKMNSSLASSSLAEGAVGSQVAADFDYALEIFLEDTRQQHQEMSLGGILTNVGTLFASGRNPNPTKVEFRVIIQQTKTYTSDGWLLCLSLGGKEHVMEPHELGYRTIRLVCGKPEYEYYYTLVKEKGKAICNINELMPKSSKKQRRFVKLQQGSKNIIYDVAIFAKNPKLPIHWESQINLGMRTILPPASHVHSSIPSFCVPHIFHWLQNAQRGWDFKYPTLLHKLKAKTIEDHLEDWLLNILQKQTCMHVVRNVICTLSVVVAMCKTLHVIKSADLFEKICEGLQIQDLNQRFQNELYDKIKVCFDESIVLPSIRFFLEKLLDFPDPMVILILPLYGLVWANGKPFNYKIDFSSPNLLVDRALLPNIDKNTWDYFRQRMLQTTDDKKLKKLIGMSSIIQVLAETHPYIVDTYLYFIPFEMLMDLIKEKSDIIEKFQIDSVFARLLPLLEPMYFSANPSKRNDVVKSVIKCTSRYLEDQFHKEMDPNLLERKTEEDKRILMKKSFKIMESIKNTLKSIIQGHYFSSVDQQSVSWLLTMAGNCILWSKTVNRPIDEFNTMTIANEILQFVKHGIFECQQLTNKIDEKQLEFYSNLLNKKWADDDFQIIWEKEIAAEMQGCIQEQWCELKDAAPYLEFYEKIPRKSYHSALDKILLQTATECVQNLLRLTNPESLIKRLRRNGNLKPFANVIRNAFQTCDDKDTDFDIKAIKFIAESSLVLILYKTLESEDITKLFDSKSFSELNKVHKKVQSLAKSMSEKTITVQEMKIILENRERMEELLAIIESNKHTLAAQSTSGKRGDKEVNFLLRICEDIVEAFDRKMNALKFFTDFCSSLQNDAIQVQCNDLKNKVIEIERSFKSLKESSKAFIEGSDMDKMISISDLKGSSVLALIAQETVAKKLGEVPSSSLVNGVWIMDWKTVLDEIWQEITTDLVDKISKLKTASLSPDEITKIFCKTEGDAKKLKTELRLLYNFHASQCNEKTSNLEKEVSKRTKILVDIFVIQRHLEILKWFSDFKTNQKLEGDFATIDDFQKNYQHLSEQQFARLKKLTSIERQQFDTLQKFSSQSNLIEWLQTTMKEGQDDVRGLCLVAEESSRHELINADRWTFLNEAVEGFHDLVFNLDKTKGIEDLFSRCERVWKKTEGDTSLIKKWVRWLLLLTIGRSD